MTFSFTFTLTTANQPYYLWKDIIAPMLALPALKGQFLPGQVCELKIQNLTAGSNVYWSGLGLTGGSWDVKRTDRNVIDLQAEYLVPDTAGAQINVSIISN